MDRCPKAIPFSIYPSLINAKTMKGKYILFSNLQPLPCEVSAQTLEQARTLFTKGEYEQAKPVFKKYTKSQPSNGNYSYWYGVCCLKTGEAGRSRETSRNGCKKTGSRWTTLSGTSLQ